MRLDKQELRETNARRERVTNCQNEEARGTQNNYVLPLEQHEVFCQLYEINRKMAWRKAFCFNSVKFEHYVTSGIEALISAFSLFKGEEEAFVPYCLNAIKNGHHNAHRQFRDLELEDLAKSKLLNNRNEDDGNRPYEAEDDEAETDMAAQLKAAINEGALFEEYVKGAIVDHLRSKGMPNEQRDLQMVIKSIGLYAEPMDYHKIADEHGIEYDRCYNICVDTIRKIKQDRKAMNLLRAFVA